MANPNGIGIYQPGVARNELRWVMIKEAKRSSSLWIKTKSKDLKDFAWQEGCGIFSIGFSQIEPVKEYIAGQDDHHRKVTFQDEFRQLLKRYEIEFDERYVWT